MRKVILPALTAVQRTWARMAQTPRRARLFWVRHDNTKQKFLSRAERERVYELEGTHYAKGTVTLENGLFFDCLSDFHEHFERGGWYEVIYDGEESEHV